MKKKIETFIINNLKINNKKIKIKNNASLLSQNFDSLDLLKLFFLIEKKFKLKIKAKDYEKLNSINNLIEYILKNGK